MRGAGGRLRRFWTAWSFRHNADAFPRELPFGIQKVADLGLAVALGSSFVSMDAPFSGMDQDERSDVSETIQGMTRSGISVLLISKPLMVIS